MRLLPVILFLLLSGCASSSRGWLMPDNDDNSPASGDAFAGSMSLRKEMPHREEFTPYEFYYKHCAVNGGETYYSATSYDCSGPSF